MTAAGECESRVMVRLDWKGGTFHVVRESVHLGYVLFLGARVPIDRGMWHYVDEEQAALNGWHVDERAALEHEMEYCDRQARGYRQRADACERALAAGGGA